MHYSGWLNSYGKVFKAQSERQSGWLWSVSKILITLETYGTF